MTFDTFRIQAIVVGALLWLALVFVAVEFIQYSRNTLVVNGRWASSKPLMQMDVMGSGHFLFTRNALHGNKLNLTAWHGFNEMHFNEAVQPLEIEYRFRLDPDAHLSFIVGRNEAGHTGIRLSRHEKFPSMLYRADRTSRFLARTPLSLAPGRLSNGWHTARLSFRTDHLTAYLDDAQLAAVALESAEPQIVGLRAGGLPAVVDSARIVRRDGETVLDESFCNRRQYGKVLAGVAILSLIPTVLGAIPFLRQRRDSQTRVAAFRWIISLALSLVLLSLVFAFDYFVWSSRYLNEGYLPGGVRPTRLALLLESFRERAFRSGTGVDRKFSRVTALPVRPEIRRSVSRWDGRVPVPGRKVARFSRRHPSVPEFLSAAEVRWLPKEDRTVRLGFLGTSQTFGVGAETISDTFVARTYTQLARTLENAPLETFNLSIPGSDSTELLGRFMEHWRFAQFDLLIVNLSNNDWDVEVMSRNLRTLALEVKREGGQIVFVLEPNSIEWDLRYLLRNQAAMRKLGNELGVPVWDLHGYLSSEGIYDSGSLWWDHVHMTSYAQGLTAPWLAERIGAMLRARDPRSQTARRDATISVREASLAADPPRFR